MEKTRSGTTADEIAEIDRQIAALEEEERASGQRTTCDHGKAREVREFKPIESITAAELDALEIQPIDWLVKDILPVGLSILGAPSKYYKSYMALGLCVAICQGKDETQGVLAGASALARQQREVIIPEVDKYTYGVMAANAGTKVVDVTLTAENIYDEIIEGTKALDDNDVPDTGRILTVVPDVYRMMKKNTELNIDCDITAEQRAKGVIAMVDGMDVIKMTAKKMPERAGFMISHPVATVAPTKLEDYKIHQDPPGISGELVEGRIVYDAFVLDNKKMAIYYVENKATE